jgi:DNA (cytosine-5)-methyltransferase 1
MSLAAVSLFAGIGGFDLALRNNGVDVTAAVEIDAKARSVLAKHFPTTTLFNDVCEVTGDDLRRTGFISERGIITGGFPCQDLSVAGRRAGLDGARSGLFWEIMRLVQDLQPRWLILENVPGLLSSNGGGDMGTVLSTLAELGYGYAYRVLDAQHFGVPQRRRRVFIIAGKHSGTPDSAGPVEILLEPKNGAGDYATGNASGQNITDTTYGSIAGSNINEWFTKGRRAQSVKDFETWNQGGVSPTLNVMDNTCETYATILHTADKIVRRITPKECERLQGFPDGWTNAQNDRTRYKQTGNAVAVPVVNWIINRLVEVDTKMNNTTTHGRLCTELQVLYGEDCTCWIRQ